MGQDDARSARRAIEAINRRDLDAFLALMDEEIEIVSRIVAMEGGLTGHEGAERWWREWFSAFPDYEIEIVEMQRAGDLVLASLRSVGHGAGSDVPVEDAIWHGSRWRDGRCTWWRVFATRDEAMDAARSAKPQSTTYDENVEIVRRATDALDRGDVEAMLEEWAEDAVVDWSRSHGLDARVFRGKEEIRRFMIRFREAFSGLDTELIDAVEVADGVMVVENLAQVRGREGIEAQARSAWVITIEDGVQTSLTLYQSKREALRAAKDAGGESR